MIPIARPILGNDELAAVKEVLASGMLTQGPKVTAFEDAFTKDIGRKHGIAVANGTAALHIALLAHGIVAGAEVLIPPVTFFATASSVLVCYNYRMTEIAAAIGLVQLQKLDGWVKQRRANAAALTKGLEGIDGLVPPSEGNWMVHSYYQYIVRREDSFPISRDEIVRLLTEDGVGSRPSYPMPLYQQKALRDLRIRGRCPVAEDVVPRLFELPVHPGVGPTEVERILAAVERIARP